MLRIGILSELGTGEYLGYCRVSFDEVDMVSAWLPMPSAGTKTVKHWQTIEVGSQVICLMDAYCEQGVVVAALWSDEDTPPDWASDDTLGIQFADGAILYYDSKEHKAFFDAPDTSLEAKIKEADIEVSDNVKLKCNTLEVTGDMKVTGDVSITGDTSVTGKVDATGNVTSMGTVEGMQVKTTAGTTLSMHMHTSAAPGSPTSPPVPGT